MTQTADEVDRSAPARYPPPPSGLWYRDPPVVEEVEDELTGEVRRKVVRGGMWPSGLAWWNLPNRVRLFVGGYGSGKTLGLCKRAVSLALYNSPVPGAIVSPSYPVARETVVVTMKSILESQRIWQRAWGNSLSWSLVQRSPMEFNVTLERPAGWKRTTGRILVYSGEDPKKLKGPNLAFACIDEPFIQEQAVFEQMVVRVRHPQARRREVDLNGTPEQLNWGFDLAEGDLRDKYDVGIVQASSTENLALPDSYLKQLTGMFDERAASAYVHGRFVNLAKGLVYYAFDRAENVVDLRMPEGAQLGCGMDFNVDPMAFCVFWHVGGSRPHVHFFDEFELPNSDTPSAASALRDLYWEPGIKRPHCAVRTDDVEVVRSGLRDVYPDSNSGRATNAPGGKTDYDHLEEAGFEVHRRPGGNPPRRDRFNVVNAMMRAKEGRISLTVSPRCRKLVKYSMNYSHEKLNDAAQKRMSHLLDARDYPVARLFGKTGADLREVLLRGA